LDELANEWIQEIAARVRLLQKTKITLSFDLHEILFYGDSDKEWIIGMKRKKGTLMQLISNSYEFNWKHTSTFCTCIFDKREK
jgi:hypothetical protein